MIKMGTRIDGGHMVFAGLQPGNVDELQKDRPIIAALSSWGVPGDLGLRNLAVLGDTPDTQQRFSDAPPHGIVVLVGQPANPVAVLVVIRKGCLKKDRTYTASITVDNIKLELAFSLVESLEEFETEVRRIGLIGVNTLVQHKGFPPGHVVGIN